MVACMQSALRSAAIPNLSKSCSLIACRISKRSCSTCFGHVLCRMEVRVVCSMASDELIFFCSVLASASSSPKRRVSQRSGSTSAKLSSGWFPACHSTNPQKQDLAALPLPKRAIMDSSFRGSDQRKNISRASVRAAKPDADDATPAAVGQSLSVSMRKKNAGWGRMISKKCHIL